MNRSGRYTMFNFPFDFNNFEEILIISSKVILISCLAIDLIILGFTDRFKQELPMEYAVELNNLLKQNI